MNGAATSEPPTGDPLPGEASVELHGVSKRFGGVGAVEEVSLAIRRGELFSLLGPSGCGKTTLLRMIAGLERPSAGSILIEGRDVSAEPPYRRPVNMVFQHYALFPHLTVEDNVAFGLRYLKAAAGARRVPAATRVRQTLALVRLGGFEKRFPAQLSGGQRQRVALARALALEPAVLLLDEPLGALDRKLREEMQVELKDLQHRLGITFVFVTHDQEEALTLSDRIAVMSEGRVVQVGAAAEVFESPRSELVARFMGASNVFVATVRRVAGRAVTVELAAGGAFEMSLGDTGSAAAGEPVRLVVRPEKLALRRRDLSARGVPSLPVTVEDRVYHGASTQWRVRDGRGAAYVVSEPSARPFAERAGMALGDRVFLCWSPRHAVLLRDDPLRTESP